MGSRPSRNFHGSQRLLERRFAFLPSEKIAIPGLPWVGNKLRKLEYGVPDILASGADTLVSIGGVQSNHTRIVAAVAAEWGSSVWSFRKVGCHTAMLSTIV